MEATKRPLRLRPVTNSPSEGVYHLRNDDQGHRIGLIYERKHAVVIVQAVNHFEETIAHLEFLNNAIEQHLEGPTVPKMNVLTDALRKARALLAKIKEG